MFTPPPSPAPPRPFQNVTRNGSSAPHSSHAGQSNSESGSEPSSPSLSPTSASARTEVLVSPAPYLLTREQYVQSLSAKRRTGRRTRWTVLLVPVALVVITLSTRYLSHPVALDALSPDQHLQDWQSWGATLSEWRLHKRHPSPDPQTDAGTAATTNSNTFITDPLLATTSASSASAGTTSAFASSLSASDNTTLPTIPSSPPVLPTPFPQPWDTSLGQTFSTETCQIFFQNLTDDINFRTCRPFSLLLQSSSNFIRAQDNLTYLNTVVWGTCNTDISADQCTTNMDSFADTLQTQCATDLQDGNAQVVHALTGLQAYTLMRSAACLANETTDTYCYVDAVQSTRTADLYVYALPLGSPLPASAHSSCSGCTQNLMDAYVQQIGNLTSLQQTYAGAAQLVNADCGAEYVQSVENSTSAAPPAAAPWTRAMGLVAAGALLAAW